MYVLTDLPKSLSIGRGNLKEKKNYPLHLNVPIVEQL